jgi:hypothetical protein
MKRIGAALEHPAKQQKHERVISDAINRATMSYALRRLLDPTPISGRQLIEHKDAFERMFGWQYREELLRISIYEWVITQTAKTSWFHFYFGIALECDAPILEALHVACNLGPPKMPDYFHKRAYFVFFCCAFGRGTRSFARNLIDRVVREISK